MDEGEKGYSNIPAHDNNDLPAPFMDWLYENGCELNKVSVVEIVHWGRGLAASEDIGEAEELISIPESLWMHPYNTHSPISSCLDFVWTDALQYQDNDEYDCDLEDVSLVLQALLLMYERKLGDQSFWSEYIKLMPHPACPFYFSNAELAELQNSEVAEMKDNFVTRYMPTYEWSLALLRHQYPTEFPASLVFTNEDFYWAANTVMQRSFSMEIQERTVWLMVPYMDLINHMPHSANHYFHVKYDDEDDRWIFQADKLYKEGTQLFISYSQETEETNTELLLQYGFVVPDNDCDIICLRVHIAEDDEFAITKGNLMADLGLWSETGVARDGLIPKNFVSAVAIDALTKEELEKDPTGTKTISDRSNILAAYERILASLQKSLKDRPTTLEADQELLLSSNNKLSLEVATAVTFRIEFKKLIRAAERHTKDMVQKLQDPNTPWEVDVAGGMEHTALITLEV